jgi:hypothetical protein
MDGEGSSQDREVGDESTAKTGRDRNFIRLTTPSRPTCYRSHTQVRPTGGTRDGVSGLTTGNYVLAASAQRQAITIDTESGTANRTLNLDLWPDDKVRVGGTKSMTAWYSKVS